ncbi:MAG: trimethylamine methyltransferase family protein [Phycisphaerae bacterium]|nr:trimethylamine methyltransferase family protein [Phycisphaerae bacterium]
MAYLSEPLRFLDSEEMRRIHAGALRILEETGMWIDHDESLEILRSAGCRVDGDARRVTFPVEVVEAAVVRMREAYSRPDRVPARMAVRYSHVRFRSEPYRIHSDFTVSTGGFCCFLVDLEGRRRRATIDDVRASLRLADALPNIDLTGLPVSAQEVPHHERPVRMAAELVKTTRKLGGIETFCAHDAGYITKIAEVAAGGADALRREPILVGYGEARSPLCFDRNMAEIFVAYVRAGLPQTLDTMVNGGATAPMTPAACLALGMAETLSAVVLAQAIDAEAVVGVDLIPSFMDMSSGIFRYAGPERWPLLGARLQLQQEFYGCPAGVHGGKTDACVPGVQVGIEKAMSMIMPVLCGAVGVGTVGHLENAVTFSPVQLVIDDAIAAYVRRSVQGLDVTDETLALESIREIGPGGEFLTHPTTAEWCRESAMMHSLFERAPWQTIHNGELVGMEARARAEAERLMGRETERPLTADQESAIDEIVEEGCRTHPLRG